VCLLVACLGTEPGFPLVVAANRDERYDRPARPLGIVGEAPRVLAGTDEEAGGTWLATNALGVVAGLTNQPAPDGRDPTRCTRGELPLRLARHPTATDAVAAFVDEVDPARYNPCSIMVGDADTLYSLELDGSGPLRVVQVGPGRHVLENRPFGTVTPKTSAVAARLAGALPATGAALGTAAGDAPGDAPGDRAGEVADGEVLQAALSGLLADHRSPGSPRAAACVHTLGYGTRSATIVLVSRTGPPRVWFADGPPCTAPFVEATADWAVRP
jgi:hypothetical protein